MMRSDSEVDTTGQFPILTANYQQQYNPSAYTGKRLTSMGATRKRWSVGIALVTVLLAATVAAQTDPTTGGAGAAPDAVVPLEKGSQLSLAEMTAQANRYLSDMNAVLATIRGLEDKAREEKDIIRANCVRDKLRKVESHIQYAQEAIRAMADAAKRGDDNARDHEFSKLTLRHQKVTLLRDEAKACLGAEQAYVGPTDVQIKVDDDIAQTDPTQSDPFVVEPGDILPLASEYR